jgi:hypothetical protein
VWWTPRGERILAGAEAHLVRASIARMVAMMGQEAQNATDARRLGILTFDRLSTKQQLAVLADVGEALLYEHVMPPELSAWREGGVAAILANVHQCVEIEMNESSVEVCGEEGAKSWRQLVLDALPEAYREQSRHLGGQPFPEKYNDRNYWYGLLDIIDNEILWDTEWLNENLFIDVSAETASLQNVALGMGDNYFTAAPPDPRDNELPSIRDRLDQLLGRK